MPQYRIGFLIKNISDRMRAAGDNDLRGHGLTFSQAHILFVIENAGGSLAQKNIERILDVSHPTVTGLIARLQEKGFVECGTDPSDRRNKIVTMTPKAFSLANLLRENRSRAEEELLAGLSEEEMDTLGQLLLRLYANMDERKVQDDAENTFG